ncbi:glycosyl hydrolase [Mycena rebaudengoi]|nr:glycosyl hydrolase [Mycena rebaudengoi]
MISHQFHGFFLMDSPMASPRHPSSSMARVISLVGWPYQMPDYTRQHYKGSQSAGGLVVIPDKAEAALSFRQICRGAWREGGRVCGRRRRRGSARVCLRLSAQLGTGTQPQGTQWITWTLVGTVWPNGAPWTDGYTGTSNGTLWAPDCTVIDNTFYVRTKLCFRAFWLIRVDLQLYYSASHINSRKSSTGMPGSWTDQGLVTSTTSALDYNVNNGNWYLSFGSFWSGIKLQQVSTTTRKPLNSSVTSLATRTAANGAIETSSVFKVGSFYYLFTSWDKCCLGTSSTYNIRVGRSSSPTGGFVDASGVALTHGGGTSDLMADDDGTILIYHYYNSTGSFRTSWLLITLVGPYYANFTSSVQV